MKTIEEIDGCPLAWPPAWKRRPAGERERANFGRMTKDADRTYRSRKPLTVDMARRRLQDELRRLGATEYVISTNMRLRRDGEIMGGQRDPDDPAVAVYFRLDGKDRCLPCDAWDRVADNLAAVAKFVDSMRGQIRWGVGDVNAMFAGFKALPGPDALVTPFPGMTVEQAAGLMFGATGHPQSAVIRDAQVYRAAYREAAKLTHPDTRTAGQQVRWELLQQAKAVLDAHHKL